MKTAPNCNEPGDDGGITAEPNLRRLVDRDRWAAHEHSNNTTRPSQIMKKQIILGITCMAAAFAFTGCLHSSKTATQQDKQHLLQYTLRVTPEIKRAFQSDDSIKIRSITGTAPKFRTGGTYRVVGTCTQQTLKNATLYLGNTAEEGPDAIVAGAGSSLFRPLPNGTTEFDITFTLLRPGLLHVTIYDMDNHNKNDNAYAGIYLGDVVDFR
jgi:hypothetical protein